MTLPKKFPPAVSCDGCGHSAAIHGTRTGRPAKGSECHARVFDPTLKRFGECDCWGYVRRTLAALAPLVETPVDPHEPTRQRTDDHVTSVEGARDVSKRAPNQRLQMLMAFEEAGEVGYTDEEAAVHAGLDGPRTCFWKRASELRADAFIKRHPDPLQNARKGSSGVSQHVWVITALGHRELRSKGLSR